MAHEWKSPWDYNLQPRASEVKISYGDFIYMAHELSDRVEIKVTHYPNKLFYIPGSTYLAAIIAKNIGIPNSHEINSSKLSQVSINSTDSIVITAHQNLDGSLVKFARKLRFAYNPKSIIVGVLFENPWVENKADIAIYTSGLNKITIR